MFLITCPYCGPRPETEFQCGGEAHIVRPAEPDACDDGAWADYLFHRTNPKGTCFERWRHVQGCGRWFNVQRDTRSDIVVRTYRQGETRPDVPVEGLEGPHTGTSHSP
ncbi:MAG: sarcosine oxidase subunit delta [Geminicoccaceae bacterium]